jgi:broad specificity phosphatase PhoE
MTRLILARHGETIWHESNRYCGASDIALSARGMEQAEQLAGWAKKAGLAGLWTSNLLRARQTGEPVTRETGLAPRVDARLRELDFGQVEGKTPGEVQATLAQAWADFVADPVVNHLPGGEDPREAVERGDAAIREIVAAKPAGPVLVVMHSSLIRLLLCRWMGISISEYRRRFPVLQNVGLTDVGFDEGQFSLNSYNVPPKAV